MRGIRFGVAALVTSTVVVSGMSMSAQAVDSPAPLHQLLSAKVVRFDREVIPPTERTAKVPIRAATADAARRSSTRRSARGPHIDWVSGVVIGTLMLLLVVRHGS
jgi:hypothetical protein